MRALAHMPLGSRLGAAPGAIGLGFTAKHIDFGFCFC